MRRVTVEMPEVTGERVVYRWTEPDPSPWQHCTSFEIVYPGVPLERFSPELLLEVFISLQWRIWRLHGEPVDVRLPVAMPRDSVAWWQAFHRAAQVSGGPLSDGGYDAWSRRSPPTEARSVASFFGAGKDSTLARSVLAEVYGEEDVLLVQMVHPFVRSNRQRAHLRQRQKALMIDPVLADTRLDASMIETDFIANLTKAGRSGIPHTNLYTVGSLPVLLHRGVRCAAMSNEMTAYWWQRGGKAGREKFGFPTSRPEVYRALSAHLAAVAGIEIEYGNTHFPISELLSYRILLERYPQAFDRIVMCMVGDLDRRWCMSCKKCSEYVHFGLLNGRRLADVDYERFWESSKHIQDLLALAEQPAERDPRTGNLPWDAVISRGGYHFASFCHTHASLRADALRALVPVGAHRVLDRIAGAWGSRTYGELETISADAIELADSPMLRAVAAIYAQHAPLRSGALRDVPCKNLFVDYDFSRRTDGFGRAPQGAAPRA